MVYFPIEPETGFSSFPAGGEGVPVGRFITNQNDLLSELLKTYIPNSKQLDFLVGYFYFSSFYAIYKEIEDRYVRILAGMEADVTISHIVREYADITQTVTGTSNQKIRQGYYDIVKKIINQADIVDTREGEASIKFFVRSLITEPWRSVKPKTRPTPKCTFLPTAMITAKEATIPAK
jgi:hypothetical protein